MYVLTNEQMREADAYTIQTNTPSLTLMERAGRALKEYALSLAPIGKIVCVCGGGNNGGDGFVCTRLLKEAGREVSLVCIAEKFSVDCQTNKEKWLQIQGEIVADWETEGCALIIDCLYGTGFHGVLQGEDKRLVEKINAFKALGGIVLSADIPSGVNGDNGFVEGIAVQASHTLCIGEIKAGALLNDGKDYTGEWSVADIGIILPQAEYAVLTDRQCAKKLLPKRKKNSHKGNYGKVAIVAGSEEYSGAAMLSALACLRSGAGYTTLCLPEKLLPYFYFKQPELLLKPFKTEFDEKFLKDLCAQSSIAYGMGMGVSENTCYGATYLLRHFEGRLLLDADGLNSLAKFQGQNVKTLFQNRKCALILTPHCKELSRLWGKSVEEILRGGIQSGVEFAEQFGVSVVLKGATSVITNGKQTFVCATGNSGQAKAGSGDVLSGLIAGLCAQGLSVLDGGALGCFLAGRSAELASKGIDERSLTASDCIEYLGQAFLTLSQS